jgi:hypothetical protein
MKRGILIGSATIVAAMAVFLFGYSALAADQPMEKPIGPAMESGNDLSDHGLSMQRIDPKTGELTKEMEQPMRTPNASDESESPGYRPLCGPAKHAINHYACRGWYDVY